MGRRILPRIIGDTIEARKMHSKKRRYRNRGKGLRPKERGERSRPTEALLRKEDG